MRPRKLSGKGGIIVIWVLDHALYSLFKHWHGWKKRSLEIEMTWSFLPNGSCWRWTRVDQLRTTLADHGCTRSASVMVISPWTVWYMWMTWYPRVHHRRSVGEPRDGLGASSTTMVCRTPSGNDAQDGGLWAGTFVHTINGRVSVMVNKKRWIKTRMNIWRLVDELSRDQEDGGPRSRQGVDHRALESDRGFLIYVSQTYPSMVPYLKGIHMNMDSWR
jgi:hypothetical protein